MLSSEWWSFKRITWGSAVSTWAPEKQTSRPMLYLWSCHPAYWMLELPEWSWGCSSLPIQSENTTSVVHKHKQVKSKLIIFCKICGKTKGSVSLMLIPLITNHLLIFVWTCHLWASLNLCIYSLPFPLWLMRKQTACGHVLSFAHSYGLYSVLQQSLS